MTCDAARAHMVEAVLGAPAAGFTPESLDDEVRSHLAGCEDCREFLKDLVAMNKMAGAERSHAESQVAALVESRLSLPAIDSAIEEGLKRRESAARPRGASLLENLAFLAFAAVVLTLQVSLLTRLRPEVVIGVEAGLNWLAPLTLYIIYRLDRRLSRREEEGSR